MNMKQSSTDRSKYLSFLLRHKPESANLSLDKEGWCSIDQLLANTDFSRGELYDIVDGDQKVRYSLSPDALKIRANQGHSTDNVQLTFKVATPPVTLYHGTSSDAMPAIMKHGLKAMKRHHVHLSADLETAKAVGSRRKHELVIFSVDTKAMLEAGYKFFISENDVWLTDHVPAKYLQEVQ